MLESAKRMVKIKTVRPGDTIRFGVREGVVSSIDELDCGHVIFRIWDKSDPYPSNPEIPILFTMKGEKSVELLSTVDEMFSLEI